ncbi:MAG: hypothetical protein IPO91_11560 [Chloroflexi bacterium]|uniref:hypothetical protein n=1 Tax=Candidatus Flexifilum breve TaxID=3140694 RepID=UPI003136B212|nr:hypothetical protein [Chloroflexota bacterium]MBK9747404.1 hypothetical protein [Chloroflexota bacterium]
MRLRLIVVLLALALAACGAPTTPNLPPTVDPSIITWDRSPNAVVFRADVLGGEDAFGALDDIPQCTIFGDNRVVWLNELGGFHFEVLYDAVTDAELREFIRYLTVDEGIYTFNWSIDSVFGSPTAAPVFQSVDLTVNGLTHRTDSFSGWDSQLFIRVLTMCKRLGDAPILYQPAGGWVSVQPRPYNPQAPISQWDGARMGFGLAAANGAPARWVNGEAILSLWTARRTLPTSLLYTEDNSNYYAVALQLPGITRDALAAP